MVSNRAFIFHVYSEWQDLSKGTKVFELLTLTLKFDIQLTPLILKSLNLKYRLYWSETKSPISFSRFLCKKKVGYFEIAYIENSLILKSTLGPLRW
jgi:hypothetical protein